MSYQTGTAASAASMLTIIKIFAQVNGFTLSGNILAAGASFTKLVADTRTIDSNSYGYIGLTGGTESGFTVNVTPEYMAAPSSSACVLIPAGDYPITYHLFGQTSPTELVCIMQYGVGLHTWLSFGNIRKTSALFTGGNYFAAMFSSRNASLGPTSDNVTTSAANVGFAINPRRGSNNFGGNGGFFHKQGATYYYNRLWKNSFVYLSTNNIGWGQDLGGGSAGLVLANSVDLGEELWEKSPNIWNSQTTLFPIRLTHPVASNLSMDFGDIPIARFLRIDYLNPGDIITLGADTWKCFPICKKDTVDRNGLNVGSYGEATPFGGGPKTGTFGWAFKTNI